MTTEVIDQRLIKDLERAIVRANVGTSSSLPVGRRADNALRNLGIGWKVDVSSPKSVKRATAALNNGRG